MHSGITSIGVNTMNYLERLEQHWALMAAIQATAITDGGRQAIGRVMDAFSADIEAELQAQKDGKADREESSARREGWQ
jgi:hypothetical protein